MRFILGVDGGQTSLKCALASADGTILGRGTGRGIFHLAAAGGPETFKAALAEAAAEAWNSAGLQPQPLAALAMGLTGVSSAATEEAITATRLAGETLAADKIIAENDALIACSGAHAGQPGIIVIAGTGAIGLGIDRQGRVGRSGGWGWLLGDEGSGFWLGREGLRAALRAQEGWGPATALVEIFQKRFAVADLIEVKRTVFSAEFGSAGFAALAPLVLQAAQGGDAVAADILGRGGQELAALALGIARQLDFAGLPAVAPVGGVFEHYPAVRASFTQALETATPPCRVIAPLGSPVDGAVWMAAQAARM